MRTVFEEDREEPMPQDRELTLGAGTLLLLFFALVLLCGLCFGVGYTFGLRTRSAPVARASAPGAAAPSENKTEKPSPTLSSAATAPATDTSATAPATDTSATAPTPIADDLTAATESPDQGAPTPESASQTPTQNPISASLPPSIMVQVAAVSDRTDAEVLLDALRKRGYPVTLAHLPSDNLMHIQVGPFSTRADAFATRQKLLSDGYNAIVR